MSLSIGWRRRDEVIAPYHLGHRASVALPLRTWKGKVQTVPTVGSTPFYILHSTFYIRPMWRPARRQDARRYVKELRSPCEGTAKLYTIVPMGARGREKNHPCAKDFRLVLAAKASGLRHDQLLTLSGGTPFFLIAGESDTIGSFALMDKALGYDGRRNRLAGINHATGHAPPRHALEAAYSFLERHLIRKRF